MWRLLCLICFCCFLSIPVVANNSSCAANLSDATSLQFDYEAHTYDEMLGIYADAILAYLNSGASLDELPAALEASNQDYTPHYAQLIQADFTADNQNEILVHLTISWGGTFEAYLMLFSCEEGNNQHLDTAFYGGWDAGDYGNILYAMDINNNQRRDIVLEYPTVEGMKTHDWLVIYEWDGDSLEQTFQLGPYYGIFSNIDLLTNSENPSSPILNVGYFYAYEEETALAFIEYSTIRPINMIYQWNGSDYAFRCRHFTDNPSLYPTALHSAEAYRSCGNYDSALVYYNQIFGGSLSFEDEFWYAQPYISYPEDISTEERSSYHHELESAYYRAFAAYRMMQIAIHEGNMGEAEHHYDWLYGFYSAGEHGYVYAAMAFALLDEYQLNADLEQACEAAALAFDAAYANGDEPGIAYADDPSGYGYGFYFATGRIYAANPDNLFAVPDSIDGMVSTPICL